MPTLVMSGEVDPVTPPVWGEQIAKHLSNAKHIVMPGTGHTAGGTGCGMRIIRNFIDKGTTEGLDTSCVANGETAAVLRVARGPGPDDRPPSRRVRTANDDSRREPSQALRRGARR